MSDENKTEKPQDATAAQDNGAGAAEPADAAAREAGAREALDRLAAEALGVGEAAEEGAQDPAEIIAALEAERDDLKKKLMYALAESENIRKRAERDRRDAETYGGTRLARDLLSVHDNLARAMEGADDALRGQAPAFFEGLDLTQRELLNAFHKHKIEIVQPKPGDRFDPNLHQAMFEAPIPGAENGAIIEVMQAGFTIAGRLLRPALVGVAKAAAAAQG
jgi:molecular chaperone GrpE